MLLLFLYDDPIGVGYVVGSAQAWIRSLDAPVVFATLGRKVLELKGFQFVIEQVCAFCDDQLPLGSCRSSGCSCE